MNTEKRAVVLACVTLQFDCDRIIKIAKQIADDTDCDLRVLSVLEPTHDYTEAAWQIEYLNMVSKQFGADMTVLFDKNADRAAAEFAKKNNVVRIVTGLHDGGKESFLVGFNYTFCLKCRLQWLQKIIWSILWMYVRYVHKNLKLFNMLM